VLQDLIDMSYSDDETLTEKRNSRDRLKLLLRPAQMLLGAEQRSTYFLD
jgi:hypothetical protein